MKKGFLTLLGCAFLITGFAQNVKLKDYRLFDSVVVTVKKDTLNHAWMGGYLNPIFSEINLNQDTLTDLIVFDKASFQHSTFIRTRPGSHYRHARAYKSGPSSSRFFSFFEDYNGDGLADQVFNDDGFVAFNKNVSTNSSELKFERVLFKDPNNSRRKTINASFEYSGNTFGLNAGPVEIPAFADLDGDNDLDLAVLAVGLGTVYFYENTGANKHNSLDSLELSLTNFCWGGFEDNLNGFYVNLGNCKGRFLPAGSRHGGANLTATHLDCNGLPDLLIGFAGEEKVIGLYNNGNKQSGRMTAQDTSFPVETSTIRMPLFPNINTLHINKDTIEDFLISPMDDLNSVNHNHIQYYESIDDTGCFKRVLSSDFLSSECIDLGEQSRFTLIDINGDSLLDILGSSYKLNNGDSIWNAVFYWKNVGTKNIPSFELISNDFIDVPLSNKIDLTVASVDLNNDGAMDLVAANEDGKLVWLKNNAKPGDSCRFVATASTLDSLKLGSFPRITFYDINKDSLPDLLAGSLSTSLDYYQNIGTTSNPEFYKTPTEKSFANINLSDDVGSGYLSPAFIESDSSGNSSDTVQTATYLYVGVSNGWLYQFKNDTSNFKKYDLIDSVFLFNRRVTPTAGDLNGDDKPDMIFGMITGGASLLMKDNGFIIPPPKEKDEDPKQEDTLQIQRNNSIMGWNLFPNPANGTVTITNLYNDNCIAEALIYNLQGQLIMEPIEIEQRQEINLSTFEPGIYTVIISTSIERTILRLVKN